jgi:hypothetical protein
MKGQILAGLLTAACSQALNAQDDVPLPEGDVTVIDVPLVCMMDVERNAAVGVLSRARARFCVEQGRGTKTTVFVPPGSEQGELTLFVPALLLLAEDLTPCRCVGLMRQPCQHVVHGAAVVLDIFAGQKVRLVAGLREGQGRAVLALHLKVGDGVAGTLALEPARAPGDPEGDALPDRSVCLGWTHHALILPSVHASRAYSSRVLSALQ